MAVHINDDCISCNLCVPVCPNRAIADLPAKDPRAIHGTTFVVDPDLCTECVKFYGEPQCIKVCPTDAIPLGELIEEARDELELKADRLIAHRLSIGMPANIAYAEPANAGLPPQKGFGPKPE